MDADGYIRANIVLDEDSYECMKQKRPFSASALIRFYLKILTKSNKELDKLKQTDEEFRAILNYVVPKLEAIMPFDHRDIERSIERSRRK